MILFLTEHYSNEPIFINTEQVVSFKAAYKTVPDPNTATNIRVPDGTDFTLAGAENCHVNETPQHILLSWFKGP